MNILITGADGQLGFEVIRRLKLEDESLNITATDVNSLDICNIEEVEKALKGIDVVINCAAFTNVDLCESEIEAAYKINCDGVKNLADVCNKENAVLIHISTDYVFDGNKTTPYTEEDKVNPVTVYGKSKLAGEREAEKCRKHFILRTSWLYGENGKNFVKTMISLSKTKEFLKVVDDQTGTPTSAFDLAKVIYLFINCNDYGIYHCTGNGQAVSWYEFTKEIFRIKGIATPVYPCSSEEFNAKAPRPHYSVLENRKLQNIGKDIMRDWKIALNEFLTERNEIL
ncbi:MAG: dTDP-4-dehydrorhamnose reductase [Clostridia bacterium]|nr:dTDP-4-dehydrorhamnose reductase [Clostridia bacterium]